MELSVTIQEGGREGGVVCHSTVLREGGKVESSVTVQWREWGKGDGERGAERTGKRKG